MKPIIVVIEKSSGVIKAYTTLTDAAYMNGVVYQTVANAFVKSAVYETDKVKIVKTYLLKNQKQKRTPTNPNPKKR